MPDVIPAHARSDRLPFVVSFALFAVAGVATGASDALAPTLGATALAVGGVYCAGRFAGDASRVELAHLSLALWVGFLAIAGLHAVGLETVAAAVPGSSAVLVHSLTAVTWATLLSAAASTTFLGFREYARSGTEGPEERVLEGDTSDYSTR